MEEDQGETTPLLDPNPTSEITTTTTTAPPPPPPTDETTAAASVKRNRSVRTKVPEVEVKVYRQGKGPVAEFTSSLGGWDQDQLEVRDILEQYGFKTIFAYNPSTASRTVPIRFNPRNGRSLLPYKDGSVICVDGEPKDSLINPITRIVVGVALITILIAVVATESPAWAEKFNLKGFRIPPWLITCAIIVFTRMRKRTKDFLQKRGWC